jgi:atypical dual specificity phosphatase
MHPIIARAIFWPTYAWNLLLGRVFQVRHWWDRIDEYVILGARPLRRDVFHLAEHEHVTGVVNMCEEYRGPEDLYQQANIEQLWLPTTDFHVPGIEDVARGVEFIQQHVTRKGTVYIHCKAGRARSATVAICWLVKYKEMSLEQAQKHLSRCRPHVNAKLADRQVVREYCQNLADKIADTSTLV